MTVCMASSRVVAVVRAWSTSSSSNYIESSSCLSESLMFCVSVGMFYGGFTFSVELSIEILGLGYRF